MLLDTDLNIFILILEYRKITFILYFPALNNNSHFLNFLLNTIVKYDKKQLKNSDRLIPFRGEKIDRIFENKSQITPE